MSLGTEPCRVAFGEGMSSRNGRTGVDVWLDVSAGVAGDMHLGAADSAIGAIRFTIGFTPAIVSITAMAIFWRYPLTDERFREFRNETEYRKRQQGHLIAPDGHVIEVPKG